MDEALHYFNQIESHVRIMSCNGQKDNDDDDDDVNLMILLLYGNKLYLNWFG